MLLRELLIMILKAVAPEVDASNVAMAQEYGVDSFQDAEGLTWDCDEMKLETQPYNCKERMRWALLTISNRESGGNWSPHRRYTGIHRRDSKHARNLHKRGHRIGRLTNWCPAHWTDEGMSTVGPHGLMYVFNVQRLELPGNCLPTWALGLGFVSARIAGIIYSTKCENIDTKPEGKRSWCPTHNQVVRTRNRARARKYKSPVVAQM